MQLVPVIPQPAIGIEKSLAVNGVASVRPATTVTERTPPPLTRLAHEQPVPAVGKKEQHDKRQTAGYTERRSVCRRLAPRPLLEELRSSIDRRKHRQRNTDVLMHIDEEV